MKGEDEVSVRTKFHVRFAAMIELTSKAASASRRRLAPSEATSAEGSEAAEGATVEEVSSEPLSVSPRIKASGRPSAAKRDPAWPRTSSCSLSLARSLSSFSWSPLVSPAGGDDATTVSRALVELGGISYFYVGQTTREARIRLDLNDATRHLNGLSLFPCPFSFSPSFPFLLISQREKWHKSFIDRMFEPDGEKETGQRPRRSRTRRGRRRWTRRRRTKRRVCSTGSHFLFQRKVGLSTSYTFYLTLLLPPPPPSWPPPPSSCD
jgi:hypothetical protein